MVRSTAPRKNTQSGRPSKASPRKLINFCINRFTAKMSNKRTRHSSDTASCNRGKGGSCLFTVSATERRTVDKKCTRFQNETTDRHPNWKPPPDTIKRITHLASFQSELVWRFSTMSRVFRTGITHPLSQIKRLTTQN